MLLLYVYGYQFDLFSEYYKNLLTNYGFIDSYFWYKSQYIRTSTVGIEFFNSPSCFFKLKKFVIVFEFTNKVYSFTGQYAYFSEANIGNDIVFLPFNWYTRDPIFNTNNAFLRGIDNGSYQLQSIGFTPLTFMNERKDFFTYANTLPIEAYDDNNRLIPLKLRPNGRPQGYTTYKISFPSIIDQFVIYSLKQNAEIFISYSDDCFNNTYDGVLAKGLNQIFMYQANPTNPTAFTNIIPSLRSSTFSANPYYYNYQFLNDFVPGRYIYNDDRTLTLDEGRVEPIIPKATGVYKFGNPGTNNDFGTCFWYIVQNPYEFQLFGYDYFEDVGFDSESVNTRCVTSAFSTIINELYQNSDLISIVSKNNDLISGRLVGAGYASEKQYGQANGISDLNGTMAMFNCVDNFVDNGSFIIVGNKVDSNSGYLIYGINYYDVGGNFPSCGGDSICTGSNMIGNILSNFIPQYTYRIYFIDAEQNSGLNYGTTIPYYKMLEYSGEPINLRGFQYDKPTKVVISVTKKSEALVKKFGVINHDIDAAGNFKGFLCIFKNIIPNGTRVAVSSFANTSLGSAFPSPLFGIEYGSVRVLSSFFNFSQTVHDLHYAPARLSISCPVNFNHPDDYCIKLNGINSRSALCNGQFIDPTNNFRYFFYFTSFDVDESVKTFTLGTASVSNPSRWLIHGVDVPELSRLQVMDNVYQSNMFLDILFNTSNVGDGTNIYQLNIYHINLNAYNGIVNSGQTVPYYDTDTHFWDGCSVFNYKKVFRVPTRSIYVFTRFQNNISIPRNVINTDITNFVGIFQREINPNIYFGYCSPQYLDNNDGYKIRPGIGVCQGLGNTLNQNLQNSACFKLCSELFSPPEAQCILISLNFVFGNAPKYYWSWHARNNPSNWFQFPAGAAGSGISNMIPEGVWTTIPAAFTTTNFAIQITNDTFNMTLSEVPNNCFFLVCSGGQVQSLANIMSLLNGNVVDIAVNSQVDLIGNPIDNGRPILSIYDDVTGPYGQLHSGVLDFSYPGINTVSNMVFIKSTQDIPFNSVFLFKNNSGLVSRQLAISSKNKYMFTSFDYDWVNPDVTIFNDNTSGPISISIPDYNYVSNNKILAIVGNGINSGLRWGIGNPNGFFDDAPLNTRNVLVSASSWVDDGISNVTVGPSSGASMSLYYGADYSDTDGEQNKLFNYAIHWASNMYCRITGSKVNNINLKYDVYFISMEKFMPRIPRGTSTQGTQFTYYKKFTPENALNLNFQYDRLTRIIIRMYNDNNTPIIYNESLFVQTLPYRLAYTRSDFRRYNANVLENVISNVDYPNNSFEFIYNIVQFAQPFVQSFGQDVRRYAFRISNAGFIPPSSEIGFILMTNASKGSIGNNGMEYTIRYWNGTNWQEIPSPPFPQEAEYYRITFNNTIGNYFVLELRPKDRIFYNWDDIFDNIEVYVFNPVNGNGNFIPVNSFTLFNNIGNFKDCLIDQNGDSVSPTQQIGLITPVSAPVNNPYGPVNKILWQNECTVDIRVTPSRMFVSDLYWNNLNYLSYSIQLPTFGMDQDPYLTFHPGYNEFNYIELSRSPTLQPTLAFLMVSESWKNTGIQTYRYNIFGKFESIDFVYPDTGECFTEGVVCEVNLIDYPNEFRVIGVQIGRYDRDITSLDITSDVKLYILQGYHNQEITLSEFADPILTLSCDYQFTDKLNNPVSTGYPIYKVFPGNQYSGYYNQQINGLDLTFFYGNTMPVHSFFSFPTTTDLFNVNGKNRNVLLEGSLPIREFVYSMKQREGWASSDNVFHLDQGLFRHVWGNKLLLADPSSDFGCKDKSTDFYAVTQISNYSDNGSSLVLQGEGLGLALILNLDKGNCDYTYWGSNLIFRMNNTIVPPFLEYIVYFTSNINQIYSPTSTIAYYEKATFAPGTVINFSYRYPTLSRAFILIKKITLDDIQLSEFGNNDTIEISTCPIKLFTAPIFFTTEFGYKGNNGNNLFGQNGFNPSDNVKGLLRINGFANGNVDSPLGFMFYSNTFNQRAIQQNSIDIYSCAYDSTNVLSLDGYGTLSDGQVLETAGLVFPDKNFVAFKLFNSFGYWYNEKKVSEEINFYIGSPGQSFSLTNTNLATLNYLNFGNIYNGFYTGTLAPVSSFEPIQILSWPPPAPEPIENSWAMTLPPRKITSAKPTIYFSLPSDSTRYKLDIYVSDPYDTIQLNAKYTLFAKNVVLGLETEHDLLKEINNNVGIAVQATLIDGASVYINPDGNLNRFSLFNTTTTGPSQMFITPLNRLFRYLITLTDPDVIDIIFAAKVPFAGMPFKQAELDFTNDAAIRRAHPFSCAVEEIKHGAQLQSPRLLFPYMMDNYSNFSFTIAPFFKVTESSQIFECSQLWRGDSSYSPPLATPGVLVNCIDFPLYQQNSLDIEFYYRFERYLCEERDTMTDGIRIYRNNFNYLDYLQYTTTVEKLLMIHHIDWKYNSSTLEYESGEYNFPQEFGFFNYVGAYVPQVDFQLPNVTQPSIFVPKNDCYLYSSLVRKIRNRPQLLFIQNNTCRNTLYTSFYWAKTFTLTCSQTVQYVFLLFIRR